MLNQKSAFVIRTSRQLLPMILGILLVAGSSCKKEGPELKTGPAPAGQVMAVETMVAEPSTLNADLEVPGTLLANETTEIHPEVAGRVVDLNIREGGTVAKGALLAKLYDGDLQAQLRKIEVQLKIAEKTEERQAELLKIQGVSQQDYDLSLLQVNNLKADIDILKEAIRKTEIRAPFNGKLGLRNISPGAYVTPASILTTISQTEQIKIQFNVPERYSALLRDGMTISFSVEGSDRSFTAKITATEIRIDESTRSLAVRALVQQRDPALIPGVFAKVRILLGKDDAALLVPNSVIIPSGRTKQLYVYQGGKAQQREVETGVRDSTNIQIISGLKPGDTVITSAILFLRPGMDVKLAKPE
jgi:membrane fusion protein (multidrug efflux system)